MGKRFTTRRAPSRLDTDEFQQRLERCLTAKTYAELDQLIADFPSRQEEDRQGWVRRRRPWPFALLPLAVLAALVLTGGHLIWLAIPVFFLFFVRPLFWRSWGRGYGPGGRSCGPRYPTRTETRACACRLRLSVHSGLAIGLGSGPHLR